MTDKFNVIVIDYKTTSLTLKEIDTSPLSLNNIMYLYKKCAFTSPNGFTVLHVWYVTSNNIDYCLEVYGKSSGKIKNLYEFPTPIDHTIYGNCLILAKAKHDDSYVNLSIDLWNRLSAIIKNQYNALQQNEINNKQTTENGIPVVKPKKKTITKQPINKSVTNKSVTNKLVNENQTTINSDSQTSITSVNMLSNMFVTKSANAVEPENAMCTTDATDATDMQSENEKHNVKELEREDYI